MFKYRGKIILFCADTEYIRHKDKSIAGPVSLTSAEDAWNDDVTRPGTGQARD
jgi:hypothetical protein